MYAITFGQITCGICLDDTKPVGRKFEQISAESSNDTSQIHKETTLKCGHIFHKQCVNRWFFDQKKPCPLCKKLVEKKDRYFEQTEDPAPPRNRRRFFENTAPESEDGLPTTKVFDFSDNMTEEEIRFWLDIKGNPFDDPRLAYLPRITLSGTFSLPLPDLLYADERGIIHFDI